MYIPSSNRESDPAVMLDFIEAHPLGALVTAGPDGLFATHLPLAVHRARGPVATFEGHIARANPHHARALAPGEQLVLFTGPDAYITPSWYPSKREHGRTVPTWNYVAVHAYGLLRFIEDDAWLHRHLEQLTHRHEAGREHPWAVDDAPADYVAAQRRAIVGVEFTVTRLEGKWKMSQNRGAADIDGVIAGLAASGDPREGAVGALVAERRPGTGADGRAHRASS